MEMPWRLQPPPVCAEEAMPETFGIRSEQEQLSTRLEDAQNLLEGFDRAGQVLDNVEHHYDVETAGGVTLVLETTRAHVKAMYLCGGNRRRVKIDAFDLPSQGLHLHKICSGTTPKIQQPALRTIPRKSAATFRVPTEEERPKRSV